MAGGADLAIDDFAVLRVGGATQFRYVAGPAPWRWGADRTVVREKLHVCDEGCHLRTFRRKRLTVHAAHHAPLDAVLDCSNCAGASAVVRKGSIDTSERQTELLRSSRQVAV